MLNRFDGVEHFYIASGYTDMRANINGLANKVISEMKLDPATKSAFLFCGRRSDRIKVLIWEGDGFLLMYKQFASGKLKWPRTPIEAKEITSQQLKWLLEGLSIEQKTAIKHVKPTF